MPDMPEQNKPRFKFEATPSKPGTAINTRQPTQAEIDFIYPLVESYQAAGQALPNIHRIEEWDMPQPYRRLLAHDNDMTSTLEHFHKAGIHVRAMEHFTDGLIYRREVVLLLDGTEEPVEFGSIRIRLTRFPAGAQRLIREAYQPLGAILQRCHIDFTSRPKGYIRVETDDVINMALGLSGRQWLYGRCNGLYNLERKILADIVEILPPI